MKVFLIILLLLFAFDRDRARQAYQEFQQGNFEAAEQGFREAITSSPNDSRLWYNLGNSLARQGKMDEAQNAWRRFQQLELNTNRQSLADYNLGNLYTDQEKWEESLKAYRNALRKNPDDEDARHNFEMAQRMMMQQEQQQQDQPQQNQQQQQQSESMPMQSQQDGNPEEGDQQAQQQAALDSDPQQENQQQTQQKEGELSLEDANNMLNALDNIERDLIKDFQKRQMEPSSRNEKDW